MPGTVGNTNARKHGHCPYRGPAAPTHTSWRGMKWRCKDPGKDYAARGIAVCERWQSFDSFLADMGERPPGTTLERIDNARGYSKSNCKWATPGEQANNRRQRRWWKKP